MKYSIKGDGATIRIGVEGAGSKQQELLQELQGCAEGRCTCPTQQYEKLESMQITPDNGSVSIVLKVRPGETIDPAEISHCLEHTTRKLEKAQDASLDPASE